MNENALAVFQPKSIDEAMKMADVLARSTLLPEALRGKPGDVLVTIITGQELGLTAMQAIRGMHVVKGKAILSADLMVALVKQHPSCVYFKLVESTDKVATYETERKGEGKTPMSFTIQQAQTAGLAGDNWRKYPAAMLRARAASALARAVYPDMMLGVYDETEAEEVSGKRAEKDVTPRGLEAIPTKAAPLPQEPKAELPAETQAERQRPWSPVNPAPVPAATPLGKKLTTMTDDELAAEIMRQEQVVDAKPKSRTESGRLVWLQDEMRRRRKGLVIDVAPGQTEAEAEMAAEAPF